MSNAQTLTAKEREMIRRNTLENINRNRRTHQQWHWDTRKTACPWGCGDGSGIVDESVNG
jgi:hypothetical protein